MDSEKSLPLRRFTTRGGRSLVFTALGFGAGPIANLYRPYSEEEAHKTLEAAWAVGLRYFDTAPLYGHGLSEMRVGRALLGRNRSDYLLSTKVGRLLIPCAPGEENSGNFVNTPHVRGHFDFSYDGVMRSYQESLDRLGLDKAEILFVHDTDARNQGGREGYERRLRELIDQGGWRALSDLRASGQISAIGMGVNEWEPCARLLELADPDLFLLAGRYTLLEQEPLDTLFPQCAARGVGIVIGGPFNSGVLVRGADSKYDYKAVPPQVAARVRELEAVCRSFEVPLAAAALQFLFAHPLVVSAIPGAESPSEVAQNIAMLKHPVPVGLWAALKQKKLLHPAAPVPAA